jgi:outer membrane receptor protein involved in Fe transport
VNAKTHEQLYSFRIDYNIGAKDTIYGRYQQDKGVQATFTDPINPVFNAVSNQPEYQGQINETHFFSGTAVNQVVVSGQWYSAPFSQPNPQAAFQAFPTTLQFGNGLFTTLGGQDFAFPQGRNVTQAQLSDDFSKSFGRHTLKVGLKFRRNDVTDSSFGQFANGLVTEGTTADFISGGIGTIPGDTGATLQQQFAQSSVQRFTFWQLGGYVEDDWKIRPNLTLNLGLRTEVFGAFHDDLCHIGISIRP